MIEVLPDVLECGLILVFCGTAASVVSAREGAYYAQPNECFLAYASFDRFDASAVRADRISAPCCA